MNRPLSISIVAVIALLTLWIYWPVFGFPFIDYDDNLYVYQNVALQQDNLFQFVCWAFTDTHVGHWHPVTWLSHRLDWALFGNKAEGHHLTSVLLHLANAFLLFWLLRLATLETGRSALAALLFAVHPLNVESVSWIAERKNVLSMFFTLGTLISYVHYTLRPALRTYVPMLVLFALGLMAKPMLVTLPFLMLLWDYWPLGRFLTEGASGKAGRVRHLRRLICEKLPFLGLSLLSIAVTMVAAHNGGALRSLDAFPLDARLMNAVVSYIGYLQKIIWPAHLAVYYPYPESFSLVMVLSAAALLAGATLYVVQKRREHPVRVTGWFWYLISLLPVIGLVQVGFQAMADRYAYVPLVGPFLMVCWSLPASWFQTAPKRMAVTVVAAVVVVSFAVTSRQQVGYWQDSQTLARHALAVTERNHIAHLMMGNALEQEKDGAGAVLHYRQALAAKPDYGEAWNNLGSVFFAAGRYGEAGRFFRLAVVHSPRNVQARNNLGVVLLMQGSRTEAALQFREAARLDPLYRSPRENLLKMGIGAD